MQTWQENEPSPGSAWAMPAMNSPLFRMIAYLCIAAWLVACGSGGSSSDDNEADTDEVTTEDEGDKDAAVFTRDNVAKLVSNILTEGNEIGVFSSALNGSGKQIEGQGQFVGLARYPGRFSQRMRMALSLTEDFSAWNGINLVTWEINESKDCESGMVHTSGTLDSDNKGSLETLFEQCRVGSEILDGRVVAEIAIYHFNWMAPLDVVYQFSDLTLKTATTSFSFTGSIRSQAHVPASFAEQLSIKKLVSLNNNTGEMLMTTDQISIVSPYDDRFFLDASFYSEITSGRIYDSTHGYVDYWTAIPLSYRTTTQSLADGGQIHLLGKAGSEVRLTALSGTHVRLDFDFDGDGSYEQNAVLGWHEIHALMVLTDQDGDGIHDSWEEDNGLDPTDSADAILDLDNDSFSNIDEYLQASDPNDSGSVPLTTDLFPVITISGSTVTGTSLRYQILVYLAEYAEVSNLEVTFVLPAEVSFERVSAGAAGGWDCVRDALVITCKLGRIVDWLISINVYVTLPDTPGVISATTSVTSMTSEINPSNNVETTLVEVLPPNADVSITQSAPLTAAVIDDIIAYELE